MIMNLFLRRQPPLLGFGKRFGQRLFGRNPGNPAFVGAMRRMIKRPFALILAATLPGAALAQPEPVQPVSELRAVVQDWIEVQKTLSLEQQQAARRQRQLQDRIQVLNEEVEQLQQVLDDLEAVKDGAADERAALLERDEAASAEMTLLASRIPDLIEHFQTLKPGWPDPVQTLDAVQGVKGGDASATEQLQSLLAALTAVHEFDQDWHTHQGRRSTDEGEVQVRDVYAGLGQGWFLGPDEAGVIRPAPSGWTRLPIGNRSPIERLIEQAEERHPHPEWIRVPVELTKEAP